MGEAIMISVTGALGLFALGLRVCVLGQLLPTRSTVKKVTRLSKKSNSGIVTEK
jgi:hypothetical protein